MTSSRTLILVSLGSALGSALLTLGKTEGRAQRSALTNEIAGWTGNIVTFTGEFDDEIADYPLFEKTLRETRERALAAGYHVHERGMPDDTDLCGPMVYQMGVPWDAEIVCAGAWASLTDSGLVNAVRDALRKAGFTNVSISENSIFEPEGRDADEEILDALCA